MGQWPHMLLPSLAAPSRSLPVDDRSLFFGFMGIHCRFFQRGRHPRHPSVHGLGMRFVYFFFVKHMGETW